MVPTFIMVCATSSRGLQYFTYDATPAGKAALIKDLTTLSVGPVFFVKVYREDTLGIQAELIAGMQQIKEGKLDA